MNQSPKLTREEIFKIAHLAHLEINEQEAEKLRGDLSAILTFVKKLEDASVEGVDPTSHIGGIPAVLRDDHARMVDDNDKNRTKNMIKQFPARKDNYLQVPHVFSARGGSA